MDDMLGAAANRLSLHMPGHKGKAPFGVDDLYRLDTTELWNTDDLYQPEAGIAQAQRLYAAAAGAAASLLLHGGSTAGIHAMLMGYARAGETVLLPRNAHLSAVNACILGGLRIRWIPVTQTADGYCYIAEADVLEAISACPEAKALLLTRPDFYGGALPLKHIADAAHAAGLRLVVDEAHGAHLPWLAELPSAGALGADAWTQSAHKTLPALTGCAVLHLRRAADAPRMNRILRREQTSSPSFVLLRATDDARAWMEARGAARLKSLVAALDDLRADLPALGYADAHAAWRKTCPELAFDPTRLVIGAPQGGAALAASLAELGVDVEMHDARRVVCILTAMDDEATVARLRSALAEIPPVARPLPDLPDLRPLPRTVCDPRHAAMTGERLVPLAQAAGQVAAQSAGRYPPGIPLVVPGEEVDDRVVNLLLAAKPAERFGVEGDCLLCADV